jgi:hypothetical protein
MAPQPGVQRPGRDVVFADLDGQALRTVQGIDLPAVLNDLKPLVPGRYLLPGSRGLAAGPAKSADQGLADGVVISLHALDLDRAVHPGHRVHPLAPVDRAGAETVADLVPSSADARVDEPPALEGLGPLRPTELESGNRFSGENLNSPVQRALPCAACGEWRRPAPADRA